MNSKHQKILTEALNLGVTIGTALREAGISRKQSSGFPEFHAVRTRVVQPSPELEALNARLHTSRTVSVTLGLMQEFADKHTAPNCVGSDAMVNAMSTIVANNVKVQVIHGSDCAIYEATMIDPIDGRSLSYVERY